jgi:hypothetical protein
MSQKKIEALRGQISALQTERVALQTQRLSRSEVAGKVRRMVDEWQDKAAEENRLRLLCMAHGDHGLKLLTADTVDTVGYEGGYAMLGPAMVAMLGAEHVAAHLLARLDTVPEGLDTAPRLARLVAIAAELDRLEAEEEALICAVEARGDEVLRRSDARPEIVLALAV